jgi:hypothetical protein
MASAEFLQKFFFGEIMKDTKKVSELFPVETQVTQETFDDLDHYIQEKGIERDEGYRLILGAGLGYLRANSLEEENNGQVEGEANKERLIKRLIRTESSLAVTRYRMFELQNANQNWKLSSGAIYAENEGLRALAKRHGDEISDLRNQILIKDSALEQCQAQLEKLAGKTHPTKPLPKWKEQILKLLRVDIQ